MLCLLRAFQRPCGNDTSDWINMIIIIYCLNVHVTDMFYSNAEVSFYVPKVKTGLQLHDPIWNF